DLPLRAVLDKLLAGTGLQYELVNDHTVRIARAGDSPTSWLAGRERIRVADASRNDAAIDTAGGSSAAEKTAPAAARVNAESRGAPVEEVLVTAQKRDERLQDVLVPVTALSATHLVEENLVRLQDYYNRVPGLNLATGNRGELFVFIRGLTTGWYTSPTVGTVV